MKKLIFLFAASIVYSGIIHAQDDSAKILKEQIKMDKMNGYKLEKKRDKKELRKLKGSEVSYNSQQAFAMDFPDIIPISSMRVTNFDEFNFTDNGKNMTAYYDADSKLVGTTETKTFDDLPASAQKIIKEKYNNYTIGNILYYNDNAQNESDMVLYDVQFNANGDYFVQLKMNGESKIIEVEPTGEISDFATVKY